MKNAGNRVASIVFVELGLPNSDEPGNPLDRCNSMVKALTAESVLGLSRTGAGLIRIEDVFGGVADVRGGMSLFSREARFRLPYYFMGERRVSFMTLVKRFCLGTFT
jgi:hypothetical protein